MIKESLNLPLGKMYPRLENAQKDVQILEVLRELGVET